MQKTLNIIAVIGLGLGSVFGLAGTMVTQPHLRSTFWAIDASGLVMACALLTVKFFGKGNDLVAAGFLVFAIGEGVILSGTAANLAESVPAFAAGTAQWATALLLISIPCEFAIWVRLSGIAASILFAITAMRIFMGEQLLPSLEAATVLWVSPSRDHFHRLDLEPIEGERLIKIAVCVRQVVHCRAALVIEWATSGGNRIAAQERKLLRSPSPCSGTPMLVRSQARAELVPARALDRVREVADLAEAWGSQRRDRRRSVQVPLS